MLQERIFKDIKQITESKIMKKIIIFCVVALSAIVFMSSPKGQAVAVDSDKDFFFKCMNAYPNDANICVSGQLKKHSFDTVNGWLKEYVAAHPQKAEAKKTILKKQKSEE